MSSEKNTTAKPVYIGRLVRSCLGRRHLEGVLCTTCTNEGGFKTNPSAGMVDVICLAEDGVHKKAPMKGEKCRDFKPRKGQKKALQHQGRLSDR